METNDISMEQKNDMLPEETFYAEDDSSEESKSGKGFRSKLKKLFSVKRIIIFVLILGIGFGAWWFFFGRDSEENAVEAAYTEYTAEKGDITETIEQSGVIEPYERYEITSLVKGEIVSSPFEEGDFVNEGDTLYQIDDEDAQLTIEKSQNSIEKAQISLDSIEEDISKLNIYAPTSGVLTDFSIEAGDSVNGGLLGRVVDNSVLTIDVPFSALDFEKISEGDLVTLTSALYMTTLNGTVSHKYDADAGTASDGSALKNIEVQIDNPGALAINTSMAAMVHTSSGEISSMGSGYVKEGKSTDITAEVSGTASNVPFKNGDYVSAGQLLVGMTNASLANSKKSNELSLKDSKLSMESSRKTLEDYRITAPISGTVITKNSKAGDKIDSSTAQTVMMVIADMSKMKFTITVDELDISDIKLGQTAIVDADALPDERYVAEVTSVATEGVSSGNGVTTFSVELTINEPGNLRPGMNVNANILINEAYDVIIIPEDALNGVNGTTATVLVKSDSGNSGSAAQSSKEEAPKRPDAASGGKPSGQPPMNGPGGEAAPADMPEGEGGKPEASAGSTPQPSADGEAAPQEGMPGGRPAMSLPEGFEMRNVEIGISDGEFIEIKSGISEGDVIIYIPSTASSEDGMMFPGMMMGGGMPGGGMSGGGMPGGGNRSGGGMPGGGGGMPGGR